MPAKTSRTLSLSHSLFPFTANATRPRTSILVFSTAAGRERGAPIRLAVRNRGSTKRFWEPEKIGQWERLAEIIKERNPKRIGINESETFNYGDGLTATLKADLLKALPPEFAARLHSAERLALRVLNAAPSKSLEVLSTHRRRRPCRHRRSVPPETSSRRGDDGPTTSSGGCARRRGRSARPIGSNPGLDSKTEDSPHGASRVIHRGDSFIAFRITYIGLCTDTSTSAYVLRKGNGRASGTEERLAQGNRLQDIHLEEMKRPDGESKSGPPP